MADIVVDKLINPGNLVPVTFKDNSDGTYSELVSNSVTVNVTLPVKVLKTAVPTIVAAAYATGDVIGTNNPITISNAAGSAGGTGLIKSCTIADKAGQNVALDILLFNANPSGSTFTDNAAFDLVAADALKCIGVIHFATTDWVASAHAGVATKSNIDLSFDLPSGTDIFAVIVSRGAPTYASASDLQISLLIDQQ